LIHCCIDLQREMEERARKLETKLGATAQTRRKARLRFAKRSRAKHPNPTVRARDRPKQPLLYRWFGSTPFRPALCMCE
jgi:hypothetical protein